MDEVARAVATDLHGGKVNVVARLACELIFAAFQARRSGWEQKGICGGSGLKGIWRMRCAVALMGPRMRT